MNRSSVPFPNFTVRLKMLAKRFLAALVLFQMFCLVLFVPGCSRAKQNTKKQTAEKQKNETIRIVDSGNKGHFEKKSYARVVPHDVAYYFAMMRNQEQLELLFNSQAIANFRNAFGLEAEKYDLIESLIETHGEKLVEDYRTWIKVSENRELVDFFKDALSHDVFVFLDKDYIEFVRTIKEFSRQIAENMTKQVREAKTDFDELEIDIDNLPWKVLYDIQVPSIVIGFGVSDVSAADSFLGNAEIALAAFLRDIPEFDGSLVRTQTGVSSFLTLECNSNVLPWEEIMLLALAQGDTDSLKAAAQFRRIIDNKTITFSLGVVDDFLIFTIGKDTSHLQRIGKGKCLEQHEKFEAIRTARDRRITSITWMSEELAKSRMTWTDSVAWQWMLVVEGVLASMEIHDMFKAHLRNDAEEFSAYVASFFGKPGAYLYFSELSEIGYEGTAFDWSENVWLTSARPLTIVDYLGGTPIFFYATQFRSFRGFFEQSTKWIQRLDQYVVQFVIPTLEDEIRTKVVQARNKANPLFEELHNSIDKKLLPALDNGQFAFAVDSLEHEDGKSYFHLAAISTVKDQKLLREGFDEIIQTIESIANLGEKQLDENEVPFEFPKPTIKETENCVFFEFEWRDQDENAIVTPTLGVTDSIAVASVSKQYAKVLTQPNSLKVDSKLIAADRPLCSAMHFDMAALAGVFEDSILSAIPLFFSPDEETTNMVKSVFDLIKCCRGISIVSQEKDGVMITRYVWRIEDVR